MPSFFQKILRTNKRNPKSNLLLGCLMSHIPLKTFWSWFYLLCQLSQAEILLKCCSRRCPPCSDDMEVKKLVTRYSWAPDWVVKVSQFCSTNVLADESEVWPWLWHVTCTLETIFLLKKKKKKRRDSLCTVTCQENNHQLQELLAGFLLLLLSPLPPVHQGEFQ